MISDKRIDEIKDGKAKVYSLEEVANKLGLRGKFRKKAGNLTK